MNDARSSCPVEHYAAVAAMGSVDVDVAHIPRWSVGAKSNLESSAHNTVMDMG